MVEFGRKLSLKQQKLLRLPTTRDGQVLDKIAEASGTESSCLKTESMTLENSLFTPTLSSPKKLGFDDENKFETFLKNGFKIVK